MSIGKVAKPMRIIYTPAWNESRTNIHFVDGRILHRSGAWAQDVGNKPVYKYMVLTITRDRKPGSKVERYLVLGNDEDNKFTTSLPGVGITRRSVLEAFGVEAAMVRLWEGSGGEGTVGSYVEVPISDVQLDSLADLQEQIDRVDGEKRANEELRKTEDATIARSFGESDIGIPETLSTEADTEIPF